MIFSINPLVVLGLLALRGEKLTHRHTVRVILGVAGAWLLLGQGGRVDLLGSLMAFGSVLGFALELCLMQWFLRDYDSRTLALYILISMWLLALAFWLAQGLPWTDPGPSGWWALGLLTTVSTYFGWLAMFIGIRYIGSGQVAMLMSLETVFSVSWAILFLQERLNVAQFVGGGLIMLSALLAVQRLRRVKWRPRWRAMVRA
jgi:drug/metabolite transporter, DME family